MIVFLVLQSEFPGHAHVDAFGENGEDLAGFVAVDKETAEATLKERLGDNDYVSCGPDDPALLEAFRNRPVPEVGG